LPSQKEKEVEDQKTQKEKPIEKGAKEDDIEKELIV
jgi:hypothetical protein